MTAGASPALATRGVGGIEFLRALLPGVAVDAFWLLTWLGSVAFLTALLALVYWFESREGGALALAALLGALGLTMAAKALFGLPRPPAALWRIGADGFGFPSGHAIAATVGWGALAAVLDRGTRERRLAVAAVVVALVAVSRVALGVHYVLDVVAGVVVGVALLGAVLRLGDAGRAFGAATLLAVLATAATGGSGDAVLLLGVTVGGWLTWARLSVPAAPWRRDGLLPAAGGAAAVSLVAVVGYRLDLGAPVELAVGAVAGAIVLGLPALLVWRSD